MAGSKFIVVVKYKDMNDILFHSAYGEYKIAEETKNYLRGLGHIADVISIGGLL